MTEKLPGRFAWNVVVPSLGWLLKLSSRTVVRHYAPLPEGGFILATNHVSHFDPPLISFISPRLIDWIAIRELFHGPVLTKVFLALNVIPVDRSGADRTALRTAGRRLAAGRVVGIFPEGGIRDREASILNGAPLKGGTVMLAMLTGATIVPGVIIGSDRLYNKRRWRPWSRATVWIAFGEAIVPAPGLSRDDQGRDIEARLAAAYPTLRDRVMAEFHLTDLDLPQPPRDRMQER